jgi:hypothetical protein
MWRHGIQGFLELLRHRLPATLDHMLTFIYIAYSMMALLYKLCPRLKTGGPRANKLDNREELYRELHHEHLACPCRCHWMCCLDFLIWRL